MNDWLLYLIDVSLSPSLCQNINKLTLVDFTGVLWVFWLFIQSIICTASL
jgi:hypothetical protein